MRKLFFLSVLSIFLMSGCSSWSLNPTQPPTGVQPIQPQKANPPIQPPTAIPTTQLLATNMPTQEAGASEVTSTATIPTETSPTLTLENDECGNPFYPVVNGAWWQYNLSTGSTARHSLTVGADQTFTILVEGKGITANIEGSCTDEGIILLDAPGASGTFTSDGSSSSMSTTNQDGMTLPNDVQIGDDWTQTIQVDVSAGELSYAAIINMAYQAVGYEIVSTPYGPINALKVEQKGSTSMNGSEVMAIHGFIWYGQNVGVVKNILDNISEADLVGYGIPQP